MLKNTVQPTRAADAPHAAPSDDPSTALCQHRSARLLSSKCACAHTTGSLPTAPAVTTVGDARCRAMIEHSTRTLNNHWLWEWGARVRDSEDPELAINMVQLRYFNFSDQVVFHFRDTSSPPPSLPSSPPPRRDIFSILVGFKGGEKREKEKKREEREEKRRRRRKKKEKEEKRKRRRRKKEEKMSASTNYHPLAVILYGELRKIFCPSADNVYGIAGWSLAREPNELFSSKFSLPIHPNIAD